MSDPPYLKRLSLKPDTDLDRSQFPMSLPFVPDFDIRFEHSVTFPSAKLGQESPRKSFVMLHSTMQIFLFLLISALIAVAEAGELDCLPFPGLDSATERSNLIIFGEIHGTREAPLAVSRAACRILEQTRTVVVGLEIPRTELERLNRFMEIDEAHKAEHALMTGSRFWSSDFQDGRSSKAMLDLLHQIRQWRLKGHKVSPVFFDLGEPPENRSRDSIMAGHIRNAINAYEGEVMLVLTGNLHAFHQAESRAARGKPSMAFHLSDLDPVLLNYYHSGGAAWVCQPHGCGSIQIQGTDLPGPVPRIELFSERNAKGYDGFYFVGSATASAPFETEK